MVFNYQAIADTIGTSNYNYFNGLGNMFLASTMARQAMFNASCFQFGGFTPYANNFYLTNPNWTLGQMTWGTAMYNQLTTGSGLMEFLNPSFTLNTGNTSSSTPKTEEEIGYQRKYNTLLSLLKQLEKYDDLNNADKDAITAATRNTKGNYKEKYERLKAAYDKISKETIKDFLINGADGLGTTKKISNNKDKDSFKNRLLNAGFEYKSTAVDKAVSDFYNEITKFDDADYTSEDIEGIVGSIQLDTFNIIDFISSFNSNNKNKEDGSSRVISHIAKYCDKLSDPDAQETVYNTVITPLVESLIEEAESNKKYLSEASQGKIDKAIKNLEEALTNSESSIDSELSETFDKLYLLTRLASMEKLRNDVVGYYGEIDADLFNDNLFKSNVADDLKKEGFSAQTIENAEKAIKGKETSSTNTEDAEDVEDPVAPGNSNDVEDPEDPADPNETNADEAKLNEAKASGKRVFELLNGWTDESTQNIIKKEVKELKVDNILAFLEGYYKVGSEDNEGLIEALHDDGKLNKEELNSLINKVLKKAEKMGLKTSEEYANLKALQDEHKVTGSKDFNNAYKGKFWNWTFCNQDYKEEFDDRLKALYDKMIAKQTTSAAA